MLFYFNEFLCYTDERNQLLKEVDESHRRSVCDILTSKKSPSSTHSSDGEEEEEEEIIEAQVRVSKYIIFL